MASRRLTVDMNAILDAMTGSEVDSVRWFLDLETGEVQMHLSDDLQAGLDEEETEVDRLIEENPERYEDIPKYAGHEEYKLMCRFAESVDEDDIRERLDLALQGKGAFGRFRDVVFRYPDLKAKWFAARQEALLKEALDWLDSLDIEPVYDLRRITPEPAGPPAQHPSGGPKIGLLDMLLLGAPEGKTELLNGQVLRQLNAHTPSEARALFKHLAREICEYSGVAWRKRFIENTSTFKMERAHLEMEGTSVRLRIEVPPEIWDAFQA